ncbi:MAG: DUF3352 domain-containing protein [Candidatus Aminicenantes bacterium]|nr:DUF3352 domain-containing protein [Candidatus Aminicenantes bacterium]
MKKTAVWGLIVLTLAGFVACGKKASTRAGSATAESLLNLLPKNINGVMVLDMHGIMTTESADKVLAEEKNKEKYEAFIKETGIDPKADIYYLVVGLGGQLEKGAEEMEGAFLANLRYDKDILLTKLREAAQKEDGREIKEETYNGVTLYSGLEAQAKGRTTVGAFLDESNIVLGSDAVVKSIVDIKQGRGENLARNAEMQKVIKAVNTKALVWGGFAIPPDMMKKAAASNPMLQSLESISGLVLAFDYRDKALAIEIKGLGGDADKNKNLADMLAGFKAMGGAATASNPDLGEVLNRVEIGAGADYVSISANIPQDLMDKLQKAAQQRVEGMVKPKSESEAGEEKKDELK